MDNSSQYNNFNINERYVQRIDPQWVHEPGMDSPIPQYHFSADPLPSKMVDSQWLFPAEDTHEYKETRPQSDSKMYHSTADTMCSLYDQMWPAGNLSNYMPQMNLAFQPNESLTQELCISIVTWNVAGMSPNNLGQYGSLARVIQCLLVGQKPQIIAIGLQEIMELKFLNIAKHLMSYKSFISKWKKSMLNLMEEICPEYMLIEDETLVGLMSFLFVHRDVAGKVRLQERTTYKAGLHGFFGNKGSTITNLVFDNKHIIKFCNAHLASGVKTKDRRETVKILMDEYILSHQSDLFFFYGDLNMRVGVDKKSYFGIIKDRRVKNTAIDYEKLLEHDELLTMKHPLLSEHFAEAPINFPPTYRLTKDGQDSTYSQKRVASW